MLIVSSKNSSKTANQEIKKVDIDYLKHVIEEIAIPRHFTQERKNNKKVADFIESEFSNLGLDVYRQGIFGNVIANYEGDVEDSRIIIGAHFDSVPGTPGADDNASAVAGMLGVARALHELGLKPPISYIAFNREEDGLLGSTDFVESKLKGNKNQLEAVHILEMIGFSSDQPGSQHVPQGLPIKISDVGDFIAVIANKHSNSQISGIIKSAESFLPDLKVKALKALLGIEKLFPHLGRSDHGPFWDAGIPALMWTDTAEFRNPNYHQPTDTPDTLNFEFMQNVSTLVLATVLSQLG